ncbi:MAG: AraC family transcriptional regulator [Clostridia bacterium]|nr:AraC family transcriptional regulator [Clostridia bacterium]
MDDICGINAEAQVKQFLSLQPITSGEQVCPPNHFWGAGVRSHYLIHYVVSGKGVYYVGPNKFVVNAGQIFVVFPGTVIKYQADSADPWHYAWVSFTGDYAKEIFKKLKINIFNPIITVKDGDVFYDIIKKMPKQRDICLKDNLVFSSLLYSFMSLLCNNDDKPKHVNVYLQQAKNYIYSHYFEDISITQMADFLGISRKYLFAIFKTELNQSPKDFLINYRIDKACDFLRNKSLSIASVGYSVGYKDPLVFSKAFKLKTGLSPTEYRKTI